MDIILGVAFGSCLHLRHPQPGASNIALAKQISDFLDSHESEGTIVVTESLIASALNVHGHYPDHVITTRGRRVLETAEFLRSALAWLSCDQRVKDALALRIPLRYHLAVQQGKHRTALRCVKKITGVSARLLSRRDVPCDPESLPRYTRSLWATHLHELVMIPFV